MKDMERLQCILRHLVICWELYRCHSVSWTNNLAAESLTPEQALVVEKELGGQRATTMHRPVHGHRLGAPLRTQIHRATLQLCCPILWTSKSTALFLDAWRRLSSPWGCTVVPWTSWYIYKVSLRRRCGVPVSFSCLSTIPADRRRTYDPSKVFVGGVQ